MLATYAAMVRRIIFDDATAEDSGAFGESLLQRFAHDGHSVEEVRNLRGAAPGTA